jgi:N-methylhydantoinase A
MPVGQLAWAVLPRAWWTTTSALALTGSVLRPLDEEAVRTAARRLKAEGVEAIAVCFLHGYLNGVHERRAAELILDEFPAVALSISSDIAPEIREYFRACTTAINAAVRPVARRYRGRCTEHRISYTKALEHPGRHQRRGQGAPRTAY